MTKGEFLDTLRAQLQGELSQAQIEGHLHYYNEYISEAIASGKTESEVLEELGSPVFIARTLVDAAEHDGEYQQAGSREYQQSGSYYDSQNEEYYASDGDVEDDYRGKIHTWNIPPLVAHVVIPIAVFVLLMLVFSVLGSVMVLAVRFFVPIMLIVFVIHIFRNYGR